MTPPVFFELMCATGSASAGRLEALAEPVAHATITNCQSLQRLDHDDGCVAAAEAQAMIIDCDDTRLARLNHRHLRVFAQTHFAQPRHKRRLAVEIDDASVLSSLQ